MVFLNPPPSSNLNLHAFENRSWNFHQNRCFSKRNPRRNLNQTPAYKKVTNFNFLAKSNIYWFCYFCENEHGEEKIFQHFSISVPFTVLMQFVRVQDLFAFVKHFHLIKSFRVAMISLSFYESFFKSSSLFVFPHFLFAILSRQSKTKLNNELSSFLLWLNSRRNRFPLVEMRNSATEWILNEEKCYFSSCF